MLASGMQQSHLFLQTGESFAGVSPNLGLEPIHGEVVFTTGMTGYVESLTDPSYAGQILIFTYPLIGNYGVPSRALWESSRIQVRALGVSSLVEGGQHWEAECSLRQWLLDERIPWIEGLDTRAVTKRVRAKGATLGALSHAAKSPRHFLDPNQDHLVSRVVACDRPQVYGAGSKTILLVDCGTKEQIVRSLLRFPVRVIRVPYDYDYTEDPFDAILLSNGPGDPKACSQTIAILRRALRLKKPIFGICLGAQLLALAAGGSTYKLRFGHRGHNQPCQDLIRGRAILTSQNHGYAIEEASLPSDWEVTFRHLNDHSVEGIRHRSLPYSAVQFHPESAPGPEDASYLFEALYEALR